MMLSYVYYQLNNNDRIINVVDLIKDFDSIDHNILKLKLRTAGINQSEKGVFPPE